MDYSTYSNEELELMLDGIVKDYTNGDIHHSLYTIIFNEIHDVLSERKKNPLMEPPEKAYERAMSGI